MTIVANMRKQIKVDPFPKKLKYKPLAMPKGREGQGAALAGKKNPKWYWDDSTHMIVWMNVHSLRLIQAFEDEDAGSRPTYDELHDELVELTFEHAADYVDEDDIWKKAPEVASSALERFDPEVKIRIRRNATVGGMRGSRGNSFTLDMLAEVWNLPTKTAQAKALGCSTETIRVRTLEALALGDAWVLKVAQVDAQRLAKTERTIVDFLTGEIIDDKTVTSRPSRSIPKMIRRIDCIASAPRPRTERDDELDRLLDYP